jgi:hypothetical protein
MKFLTNQPIICGVLLGLCIILTPLSAPAAEGDVYKITENLPWDFKVTPVLAGADRVTVTTLRSMQPVDSTGSGDTRLEIQYHLAGYSARRAANADFDQFLPALVDTVVADSTGRWHIVLQSGDRIHWLNGQCVISKEQFRQIYAGLVGQAEDIGTGASRAILCHCGAPCQQVDIDR